MARSHATMVAPVVYTSSTSRMWRGMVVPAGSSLGRAAGGSSYLSSVFIIIISVSGHGSLLFYRSGCSGLRSLAGRSVLSGGLIAFCRSGLAGTGRCRFFRYHLFHSLIVEIIFIIIFVFVIGIFIDLHCVDQFVHYTHYQGSSLHCVLPFTEDSGAYTDHRRPFFDGDFVITGHSHGKVIHRHIINGFVFYVNR
jgi:hypothetical protein